MIISVGESRMAREWKAREVSFPELVEFCRKPRTTGETWEEYLAMGKEQRGSVKDVGGFVGGFLAEGKRSARSVEYRTLLTLDIDFGDSDTPAKVAEYCRNLGCSYMLYSTHSHSEESPRYRLVVPLSAPLFPGAAEAVSRRFAEGLGLGLFDRTTHEPCRLFYWPSVAKGGDGHFSCSDDLTKTLDVDAMLDSYEDWRDRSSWPKHEGETLGEGPSGRKASDPRDKPGNIGAFCRAYSIEDAIIRFLPDKYGSCGGDRWTFLGGSTHGAAISYEDLWLYSHHHSDPCGGRLVNAYDLVRIHLFGDGEGSGAAMERLCETDPKTAEERREEALRMLEGFGGTPTNETRLPPRHSKEEAETGGQETEKKKGNPYPWETLPPVTEDWKESFIRDKFEKPKPCSYNYALIVTLDPELRGKIYRDIFHDRLIVTGKLPWNRENREEWTDSDEANLAVYINRVYGMDKSDKLGTALKGIGSAQRFHPVRHYFGGLEWDGEKRLERLLPDVMGAEDTPLNRELGRLFMVAAVTRIYEPGAKFDLCLLLVGAQGTGKSSFFQALAGEWFTDSVSGVDNLKESAAQLRGILIAEFGELAGLKRADRESVKRFISSTDDRYRAAYARNAESHPRQCVFAATSNNLLPLSGLDGNRRFPVVEVREERRAIGDRWPSDWVAEHRDQLWAEAVHIYKTEHPKLFLSPELAKEQEKVEEAYNYDKNSPEADAIAAYLEIGLPENWREYGMAERRRYMERMMADTDGTDPTRGHVRRTQVCPDEIAVECFGYTDPRNKRAVRGLVSGIMDGMPGWGKHKHPLKRGPYGHVRGWVRT